jgi:glycosyltransferase involved in cell wall biosynthesis
VKRKILFVIPDLQHGGAERVVVRLLEHLPRARFELHLALVQREGALLSEVPDDIEIHDLGAGRVRRALVPLARLIRRLQPDVVLPQLSHVNLALILLKPFLPRATRVVLHEHTTLSAEVAEPGRGRLWAAAYRLLYPRADLILCCSHAMADDMARAFAIPRQRLRVVRNPIDEERIARARVDSTSPFVGAGPHVLGVGRLAREKGYDRLIDAFALLVARVPGAELWLLGDGPERSGLEARARERGVAERVHLEGFCADPLPWFRHSDVVAQTSRREGLPVAVLESIACGARVVAFDCPGGTSEILAGLEGTALVPDGDLEALAAALERSIRPDAPRPGALPDEFRLGEVVRDFSEVLYGAAG